MNEPRRITVNKTTVDLQTGRTTPGTAELSILPAPAGTCEACATKHEPDEPHNATSMFYQYAFHAEHGRWPTWKDAMEHCDEPTQAAWLDSLDAQGIDVAGGGVFPPAHRGGI